MNLTDVYRVFHHARAQCKLLSAAHGILSKIDIILGHKVRFNKYKKIEGRAKMVTRDRSRKP
jgi:predicted MarR family transcription regulator